MCDRVGIEFFEISHLFTQWGAGHAPKVMATVDGEYKRIFGWDTDATGEDYPPFLRAMLTAFLAHMKARGDDQRCLFHISDEPNLAQLEQYKKSKATVADLLEGYTIMDALSEYEFYCEGVVTTPIPSNNSIEPFIAGGVPKLWTYYCFHSHFGFGSDRRTWVTSYRTCKTAKLTCVTKTTYNIWCTTAGSYTYHYVIRSDVMCLKVNPRLVKVVFGTFHRIAYSIIATSHYTYHNTRSHTICRRNFRCVNNTQTTRSTSTYVE
jgi:hypothetical protein